VVNLKSEMMDSHKEVVYVEDDRDLINLVSLILKRRGIEVIGVSNPHSALDTILKIKPRVILLDLMMPEVDGWEIYHNLKNRPETSGIPVIIISAKAQPIDQVLGLHVAKVDGYICKPFQPEQLISAVEQWFNPDPQQQ
jgi:two-component system, OmpR family, response regulator VicR